MFKCTLIRIVPGIRDESEIFLYCTIKCLIHAKQVILNDMFLNLGYSHDFLIFSYDFIHLLGIDKHYH